MYRVLSLYPVYAKYMPFPNVWSGPMYSKCSNHVDLLDFITLTTDTDYTREYLFKTLPHVEKLCKMIVPAAAIYPHIGAWSHCDHFTRVCRSVAH